MTVAGKVEKRNGSREDVVSKILIVEDEKLIALSLEGLVRSLGYEIAGNLSTADEAIAFFHESPADLVLMDINLQGGKDGIDAAEEINRDHGIPFIFISAFTDPVTIERAKKVKPYGYLIKPFDKKYLSTAIELALYRHKAEMRLRQHEETRYALLKAIPDLVLIRLDADLNILELSLPEKFPVQADASYLVGKNLNEVPDMIKGFDAEVISQTGERVNIVLNEDRPLTTEFKFRSGLSSHVFESTMVKAANREVIMVVRDITDRKKAEAAILQAIVKTQDDERQRFAQDLHDGLGQILTAVKFKLDSISPERDGLPKNKAENLDSAKKLLSTAIDEARSISHGLMPEVLSTFGLEPALEELCASCNHEGKVRVSFSSHKFDPAIDSKIQIGLYRIAQELLNNAVKHASATEINVQIIRHKRRLVLMVEDNGKGILPEKQTSSGMGLKNISARVALLSGELTFDTVPGRGTSATVDIPLNP